VVGLGPAGPDHLSIATRTVLATSTRGFLRTRRHPAAVVLAGVESFDNHYDTSRTFEEVYQRIVEDLVREANEAATTGGHVVYGVPGSPLVAERTVELLRADPRVQLQIIPSISFLDLAWDRLGIDPLAMGVRLVDGTRFAEDGLGERGPMLVAQCWSRNVLSNIKLSVEGESVPNVVILHHLGLDDERVEEVSWWDMDRVVEPDQLTSLWIPPTENPVGVAPPPLPAGATSQAVAEMAALEDLVRTLRVRCAWDREQTHASLAAHLMEESYEVLDALESLPETPGSEGDDEAAAHLSEELGDLLVQVMFHSVLAEEEGRFNLARVARGVHDKLVARHPHVFGDVQAETAAEVESLWEVMKQQEKGRTSVTDGIPTAMPSLALATKLQGRAQKIGANLPGFEHGRDWLVGAIADLNQPDGGQPDAMVAEDTPDAKRLGAMLFGLADLARRMGVDAEQSLRSTAMSFRDRILDIERRQPTE
jgi:tetrapyrrole methylase family protein/MazG family protein